MAKTAAEKQADFKARMYGEGFKQRQIWVDEDGFMVGIENRGKKGIRPRIGYAKFLKELKNLVGPMSEGEKEEIFAELLVYAGTFRKLWDSRPDSHGNG
jgi:hypothetical protein